MESKPSNILEEVGSHSTPGKEVKKAIGRRIAQVRKKRNQSVEKVAKKFGMSRVGLTHIENGDANVNAVQIWKLACILGCEPADFFPPVPKGFTITGKDYEKIVKEDEEAESWAKSLFGNDMNL